MKKGIFIALFIFLFTGCIKYTELNNVGIIDSLGIDYIDNNYVVIANILEINKDNNLEIKTYKNSDKNLSLALFNLHLLVNKNINYNNLSLLVLSSNLNDNNLSTIVRTIKGIHDFRNDFNTVYISSDQIYELFDLKRSAKEINNQINISKSELGIGGFISFESVLKDYLNNSNIIITNLSIKDNLINIDGYKILNNNYLTKEESILFNYVKDTMDVTNFKDDCLLLNVNNSKTIINSKNNVIKLDINNQISVIESSCDTDLSDKDIINRYNKKLSEDIHDLYNKYKSIDLFNFVDLIKKNDYKYYKKNYNNLQNNIKLNLNINSKLIKGE